jgi:hypothetical protein
MSVAFMAVSGELSKRRYISSLTRKMSRASPSYTLKCFKRQSIYPLWKSRKLPSILKVSWRREDFALSLCILLTNNLKWCRII